MIRQGKYTKKLSLAQKLKRALKSRWLWFKHLTKTQKAVLIGGPIFLFLFVTPLATYAYFARDIADKDRLMNRNNTGIVLLDKNGEKFFSTGRAEHRSSLTLDKISDDLEKALVASEDKNFYEHSGFSVISILGALYANITAREAAYGGSTLTQQLAKNTLLSSDRNFLRKFQELSIAIAIERTYTKDEILEMYLNSVYYGEGAFGIEEASKTYFAKEPADLTLAESTMIIGLLPAPAAYSPISGDPELAKQRQATVLSRMVDNNVIDEAQKTSAISEEIAYAPVDTTNDSIAPHFAQMVLGELYEKYGEEKVTRSGYQVQTTLDSELQKELNQNIENHIGNIQANGGSNASAIAIDPTSGEVRALAGSADWNNEVFGKVNMVTTPRQPGSSFKPIYYAEALAQGIITPATILEDKPTSFNGYTPQNASRTFSGDITVRNALARSLNIPSVLVMQKLGVQQSVAAAKRMGISTLDTTDYGLSLALGSAEVPLIEMTNAYAAFANQGEQYQPTFVTAIKNKFNGVIFQEVKNGERVMSAQGSYLISSILSDNTARAPIFGRSLTVPNRTVAVKTGTTDDSKDAWTIGYSPQLAIGVWVGNNDNSVMASGGSSMAGPIFIKTMQAALQNNGDVPFSMPSGIVQRNVCYSNGGLANTSGNGTYNEYFLGSALPSGTCRIETREEIDAKNRKAAEDAKKEEDRLEEEAKKARELEEQNNTTEPPNNENDLPGEEPTEPGTTPLSNDVQPRTLPPTPIPNE